MHDDASASSTRPMLLPVSVEMLVSTKRTVAVVAYHRVMDVGGWVWLVMVLSRQGRYEMGVVGWM